MSKILMATPIHSVKDYSMGRWLEAIAKFSHPMVEELLLVDNSLDPEYVDYLRPLVPKHFKTTIIHVDIPYTDSEQRVATAREEIVKKVIEDNYDYWFSWETDTIAPPDILEKILPFAEQFPVIHHLTPSRDDPDDVTSNSFGLSLIRRDVLERFSFHEQWGIIDPKMPNCSHGADSWFNRRVIRAGYPIMEVSGLVRPIEHLGA
jgi:hypothetical protein